MGGTKVLAAMLVAASFWAANAGKCKPHPNQTSLLTIASDISTAASSATNSDVRSSTRSIEATESVDAESKTSGNSPVTISYQSTTSGPLDPTTSSANLIVFTTSIDSTVSSYEGTPRDSTTNEITTSTETASTDTIKSDEQATTTDTTTWAESTTLTDTTVTTDTATTLVTSVSASESTTTESFRSSATEESCPIISSSLEDPGFERDNSGTNQWEYMLAFSGVPVPFQRKSSTSQDVPRANSVDQFAHVEAPFSGPNKEVSSLVQLCSRV
ncbi:hypothetical protein NW762_004789 [Fusarium torreyae]|uniref:Uncharacterized protein n=1 Tax=Fusarium torreyae TaxID=1237075 RepID=A0A9W8S748_9HYPO|nr:hypothetical protein NW762_004789 [Fusarium torreyae]